MKENKKYLGSSLLGCVVVMVFTILFEFFGKNPIMKLMIAPTCIGALFASVCVILFLGSGIGCNTYQKDGTEQMSIKYYPRLTGFSTGIFIFTLIVLIFYSIVHNVLLR